MEDDGQLDTEAQLARRSTWTADEDARLKRLVQAYGAANWSVIAQSLSSIPPRNGKSCRLRWFNQLNPLVRKTPFTADEDKEIILRHQQLGNSWAAISKFLPGRTDNAIKNYWNGHLQKRAACQGGHSVISEGADAAHVQLLDWTDKTSGSTVVASELKWTSCRPRTLRARPRVLPSLQPDANNRQNSSAQSSGTVFHGSACPTSSAEQTEGTSLVTGRHCSTLQPAHGGTVQQQLLSKEQAEQLAGTSGTMLPVGQVSALHHGQQPLNMQTTLQPVPTHRQPAREVLIQDFEGIPASSRLERGVQEFLEPHAQLGLPGLVCTTLGDVLQAMRKGTVPHGGLVPIDSLGASLAFWHAMSATSNADSAASHASHAAENSSATAVNTGPSNPSTALPGHAPEHTLQLSQLKLI